MSSTTGTPLGGPGLTWDEFCALPETTDDGRWPAALIDGEVVWLNPPASKHEVALMNLSAAFLTWTRAAPGRGFGHTRPGVKIHDRRGYEADFGWWPEDKVLRGDHYEFVGPPAIAVEVWSPSNWRQERLRKFLDYGRVGVIELWGIDTDERRVDVFRNSTDNAYQDLLDLGPEDELTSPMLEDFVLPVSELFRW